MESMQEYLNSFSLLTMMAAFVGTSALAWKLFDRADSALSPEGRHSIGLWLENIERPKRILELPAKFCKLFDLIFGERHLSWRCFSASCIISLVVSLILSAILLSQNIEMLTAYKGFSGSSGFHPSSAFYMLFSQSEFESDISLITYLKSFFIILLFVNIPADFLSLLQTRVF